MLYLRDAGDNQIPGTIVLLEKRVYGAEGKEVRDKVLSFPFLIFQDSCQDRSFMLKRFAEDISYRACMIFFSFRPVVGGCIQQVKDR